MAGGRFYLPGSRLSICALWYDIDYPDMIELRKRLYPDRQNYTMISSSVTDLKWLDVIPSDRPVLVVAEGLVMYLAEDAALALFKRITEKFPAGEFVFDAYSRLMTRLISLIPAVRASGITLAWSIGDPLELEKQVPDLKLIDSVSFLTMPELVDRLSESRLQRVMSGILGRLGFYRRLIRHLRYRF
ncbi:class I SAM-dependent methyltransferase [Methanocella sp. MCL-LM]|uniref:class I SAM-dependent methyltransferase n=1 Tax=Methanocella sp. MCL-LM TaxID=3412035 RepID=UPI003C779E9B